MEYIKANVAWLRERAKGWKTVIVGVVVAAPLTLLQIGEQLSLVNPATVLPEPWGQRVTLALAVVMILLRLITTGPVGSKGEEEPDNTKAGD